MPYPVAGAKYSAEAGRERAKTMCRAEGGPVDSESPMVRMVNDAGQRGAQGIARGLNAISRMTGMPYNKGAVGVQQGADMKDAEDVSDAMRPGQPKE